MFNSDSDLYDHNRTHNNDDAILTNDHLYELLTHAVPTEGMLDRPEEVHVDKVWNFMQTTDAGDISLEIEEEMHMGLNSRVVILWTTQVHFSQENNAI